MHSRRLNRDDGVPPVSTSCKARMTALIFFLPVYANVNDVGQESRRRANLVVKVFRPPFRHQILLDFSDQRSVC